MESRRCPGCEETNRAEARFCDACGIPLALTCPACAAELRPQARFCDGCGAPVAQAAAEARAPDSYTPRHLADKILTTRSAIEGERKQVTVLFADVKGSLELARAVDPEDWHKILDRFFQVLAEGVHRFEGTVNQYTGDGIMALFGAPIAHEDHAQRACYAALQLRDDLAEQAREVKREHGLTFSTRIGIHSGEVVVGKIGDDLRMDYTAQGLTVGLAARMEELASPDTIYLSDDTASLVSGYFDLEDLGEFAVKGLDEPVRVHQLSSAGALRTRFDVSRARGLTLFVGRGADMQTLETALEQALAGNGQVVGVVAEAGTGKSRLCFEFLERCRARGLSAHEGHAVAHGKNIPFLPMLQVFRAYYGIEDTDDPRTVREKVAGRLLLLDEEFRDALPLVFEIFGAPDPERPTPEMDPDTRQKQLFGVLRRAVQGEGEPMIALIEDLHWMDATSEAFLEQWVDAVSGTNGLLLVNFRPEYHAEWMQKSWYRQLPLAPLGPDAIEELLDDLLGRDPSVKGLGASIHERTGGNPFFTEEVVQTLIESGKLEGARGAYRLVGPVESLQIPLTVQALLAARIDRLAEREKHVLQAAAVLGKEFAEPILEAVVELPRSDLAEALARLKDGEFLYEQALYPVAEYAFKHPLTQEVALGSQLQERRRALHASAAGALEEALSDKLDESAALLAHHWEEAGDARRAAHCHRRAAEWVTKSDPVQGVRHWQRVLEHGSPFEAEDEIADLCKMACRSILILGGWRLGLSRAEVDAIAEQGLALAERLGDRAAQATILAARAVRIGTSGDLRAYYEMSQEVQSLLDDDMSLEDRVAGAHGYAVFACGRVAEALPELERTIELCAGDLRVGFARLGFSVPVWAEHLASQALSQLGRLEEAWQRAERAIRLGRENGFSENLGWALGAVPQIALMSGAVRKQLPEPRAAALETLDLAEAVGSKYSIAVADYYRAIAQRVAGDWKEAERSARETLERVRAEGIAADTETPLCATRSQALRELGRIDEAVAAGRDGVDTAERQPCIAWGIDAQLALARALLAAKGAGAREEVEKHLARADEWLEESGARGWEPQIAEARAELAAALGDGPARARHLAEALRLYRKIGADGHAARLERAGA